ncbi:MAG: hypothetical protein AAGA03_12390 [Planctomycetota bacterium]
MSVHSTCSGNAKWYRLAAYQGRPASRIAGSDRVHVDPNLSDASA